jgi:hypothetical protein
MRASEELEVENTNKKNMTTAKFRKTKKTMGVSTNKYYHKSMGKQCAAVKDDVMTSTLLFSELRKRNMSFLS